MRFSSALALEKKARGRGLMPPKQHRRALAKRANEALKRNSKRGSAMFGALLDRNLGKRTDNYMMRDTAGLQREVSVISRRQARMAKVNARTEKYLKRGDAREIDRAVAARSVGFMGRTRRRDWGV